MTGFNLDQIPDSIRVAKDPLTPDPDNVSRIEYGSIAAAIADALDDYGQNDTNRETIRARMTSNLDGRTEYAENHTPDSLADAIGNTPPHLLKAVADMTENLKDGIAPPQTRRRRIRRNQDSGDELDPDAVLMRSPTPWERQEREQIPVRCVTVAVDMTVSYFRRSEELLWRGAAACALADALNRQGVNVEIVGFWCVGSLTNHGTARKIVARFVVKRADMPLDLGAAAMTLSSIAYARMIALTAIARHAKGRLLSGWGLCDPLPRTDRQAVNYLADQDITDKTAAERWLRTCLETAAQQ